MQIKILVASTYSKFGGDSIKAEPLQVGDERDWPDWYALSCEADGFVEIPSAPATEPIKVIDKSTVKTILAEGPQKGVERYKDNVPPVLSPLPTPQPSTPTRPAGVGAPAESSINATAGAIKLAKGFGVDLGAVEGTGKGGKITVNDVKAAIASGKEELESGES